MEDRHLPPSNAVQVNTDGAVIVDDDEEEPSSSSASSLSASFTGQLPGTRDSRDIYLPKHTEWISHIAIDIGGSLAKVVYFSRALSGSTNGAGASNGKGKGKEQAHWDTNPSPRQPKTPLMTPDSSRPASPGHMTPKPNGVLGPESIASSAGLKGYFDGVSPGKHTSRGSHVLPSKPRPTSRRHHLAHNRRYSSGSSTAIPGGWLNFTKFETGDIESLITFVSQLIEASAASHRIPVADLKAHHVKIMATGGGAHLYYERLSEELGVEVRREEEMECLITGLTFFMEIPHEVFWYSDELIHATHNAQTCTVNSVNSLLPEEASQVQNGDLPRPSPNPPEYSLIFDEHPAPHFPCLLVNIGSGVSIIKVDDYGKFERISGTSLGGGTLWGLLSMLTGAESFDEMLALSEKGDNASVDMLVGDIYGSDYSKIGLKSTTIASSFGKVFRKGQKGKKFKPEDIAKSLLYAISNNIGQIAYMNAEKHNLERIYFGGCFIRGHAATISTLSYAIRFWSKGTKRALFMRHEGYLGAIGAWLRNIEEEDERR